MRVALAIAGVGTTSQPAATIITGATPGRVKIIEIGICATTAVASPIGIGRPAALGITPTAPVDFLPEDPNDVLATGVLQMATAWGTLPTSPTNFLRRIHIPATIGAGFVFTFPQGLVLPVSSNLVIYNIGAASGAPMIYVVADV